MRLSVCVLSAGAFEKARGLRLAGKAETDTSGAGVGTVAMCVRVCWTSDEGEIHSSGVDKMLCTHT
jgi:hypothetical protein